MSPRISLRFSVCMGALCALGLGLFEHQAAAQEGVALNRFDPAEQAGVFFRGDALDIAGDRRWAAGLVVDWGHKVLVARDENGDELATVIGDQLFLHLGGSLVLVDRLRVGLNGVPECDVLRRGWNPPLAIRGLLSRRYPAGGRRASARRD